jgi:hypothetical protein
MVEIRKIAGQNLWWRIGKNFVDKDDDLKRLPSILFSRKDIELTSGNIYAIEGPRQVGKTTWIKFKIKDLMEKGIDPKTICYFSCQRAYSRKELAKILEFFAERRAKFIFLDEVNYVKDWEIEIKSFMDEHRSECCIIVTGSPFSIREGTSHLVGRGIEGNRYFLKPLSFREFLLNLEKALPKQVLISSNDALYEETKKMVEIVKSTSLQLRSFEEVEKCRIELLDYIPSLNFWFNVYLKCGGFPSILSKYLTKKYLDYREYEKFLNLTFKDLDLFSLRRNIERFVETIVDRIASRVLLTRLLKEFEEGISFPTIQNFLSLLEAKFLVRIVESVKRDLKERTRGYKKIYFLDPAIFFSFLAWKEGKLEEIEMIIEDFLLEEDKRGKLYENVVAITLINAFEKPLIPYGKFVHFMYEDGKEIDFIIKAEDVFGIEVGTKKVERDIPKMEIPLIILSEKEYAKRENKIFLPISVFLACIEKTKENL